MLLVEASAPRGQSIEPLVISALNGGVNCIQLRDKAVFEDDLRHAALELRDLTRGRASFVINDAPDIARDLKLDGVHLPEAAFDLEDRGKISWPFVVGRSVHSVEGALKAQAGGADYIVAGNVFETHSHPGKDGEGLGFLMSICEAVTIPVLAVGGIAPDRISGCINAGASGVVVRSGILLAQDVMTTARQYSDSLTMAWLGRVNSNRSAG
jgi:thiamine-phosphate diphosphorylase